MERTIETLKAELQRAQAQGYMIEHEEIQSPFANGVYSRNRSSRSQCISLMATADLHSSLSLSLALFGIFSSYLLFCICTPDLVPVCCLILTRSHLSKNNPHISTMTSNENPKDGDKAKRNSPPKTSKRVRALARWLQQTYELKPEFISGLVRNLFLMRVRAPAATAAEFGRWNIA